MRIAVIGAGVAGLGAAWSLKDVHDVTVFEKNARLGGHAHTVTVDYDGAAIDVDTGFIVYNEPNYPNLVALFDALNVATFASDMSFAVSDPEGFEWSSNGIGGLFAWKRNITNPSFLAMLSDIVRFSAAARADLAAERLNGGTLEDYVRELKLGSSFLKHYLLPMGAAIWSTPERDMLAYPAASFLRFFDNHRLLHINRPIWRSVVGGSRSYVRAIAATLPGQIQAGDLVVSVKKGAHGLIVRQASGGEQVFDRVLFACHSNETASLMGEDFPAQRSVIENIRYAPNTAYLHRDRALMPARDKAWASWNYMRQPASARDNGQVTVSYWMNLLQGIDHTKPLFVTLNPHAPPREDLTFGVFAYDHPQFDLAALAAQKQIAELQGRDGVWFAGAWLGFGFHEDGLATGLQAAAALGGRVPWGAVPLRRGAVQPVPPDMLNGSGAQRFEVAA
jgi:predicted NAD/FAD-binding protein